MDKESILTFEEMCYRPSLSKLCANLDSYIGEHMDQLYQRFQKQLLHFIKNCNQLQEKEVIGEAHTISISFLYTSLCLDKPSFLLCFYEDMPFVENAKFTQQIEADWLFQGFHSFEEDLLEGVTTVGIRKYIKKPFIRSYVLKAVKTVLYFAIHLLKYWLRQLYDQVDIKKLIKAPAFSMTFGEYLDWQVPVMGIQPEIDIFQCDEETNLNFREFTAKWYEDRYFEGMDLANCRFLQCTFKQCTFDKMILNDVVFVDCIFEACNFTESSIKGCSFIGCTLKEIQFRNVEASMSIEEQNKPVEFFMPTLFLDCTLSQISLIEGNFLDTVWEMCDLTEIQATQCKLSSIFQKEKCEIV